METHELTVSSRSIESDLSYIQERIASVRQPKDAPTLVEDPRRVHLYICTHAAVDCRCGEKGPLLVEELRRAAILLKEKGALKDSYWQDVRIMETGHVGGHKYAANMLVYPHGDWYGYLQPSDVPALLEHILSTQPYTLTHSDAPPPPQLLKHWRGRMGLTPDEQKQLAEKSDEEAQDGKSPYVADALGLGVFATLTELF